MSRVTSNQSDKNSSNKSYANRNLNDALKPQPQSLSQSKLIFFIFSLFSLSDCCAIFVISSILLQMPFHAYSLLFILIGGNRPGTFVPLVNNRRTAAKPSIVSPLGPVNTPSLKRENNGKDMFVNLVSSSGPSVWKAGSDSSGGSGNPQPAATAEAPVQSAPKPSWQNSPSATSSILNSSSSTAAASNTTTSSSSVPLPLPKSMPKQTNWADMDSDEEDDVGDYTLPLPAQPTHDPVNQAQTQAPPQSQPVYNQPSNVTVVPKPFAGQSQGGYNRLVGGQNSNFNQQYNNRQPYNSHFRDNRDRNESRERSGSSDYSSNGRWGSSGRDYNHSGPRDYNRGNFDRGDRDYHNDVYNSPPLSSTATGGEHTLEEQEALGASRRAYEQAKLLREQQQQREREAQREREMHKECDGQMDRDHRFYNEHQDRDRGEVGGFRGHHPPSQHGNNQMNQSQGHPGRRGYDRFDKPAPPVYDRHGHSRGPSSGYGPSSNGTADSGQWERSQSLPPPPPGVKISNSNFKENREREGGVTDHKQKNELRNQGQHQEEPDDYDSLVPSANVNSNKSYASLFPKQSSEQQGRENDSAAAPVDSEWSRNVGRRNDVDNVKMLYVPRMGKYVESSAALAAEKGARPHRRARSSTEDSSSSGPVPTAIMRRSDDKKAKLFNEKREEPRQSAYVSEKVKQAEIRRDIRLKIKKLLNKPHSNGVLYGYNPDSETRTLNDIVYVAGNKAMCAKNSVKNERVEKSNKAKAVTPSSTSTSGNSNAVSPSKKASVGRDSNAGEETVTKESPNDQDSATGTPAKHIKDAKKMDTMDDNFDILSEMAAMSLHDDAAYAPSGDGHDMLDITQLAEQREYMYDTSCSSFVPGMLHGGVNKNSESDVEW